MARVYARRRQKSARHRPGHDINPIGNANRLGRRHAQGRKLELRVVGAVFGALGRLLRQFAHFGGGPSRPQFAALGIEKISLDQRTLFDGAEIFLQGDAAPAFINPHRAPAIARHRVGHETPARRNHQIVLRRDLEGEQGQAQKRHRAPEPEENFEEKRHGSQS